MDARTAKLFRLSRILKWAERHIIYGGFNCLTQGTSRRRVDSTNTTGKNRNMKILISGSSGLVGTAATTALQSDGHSVAHLVRPGKAAKAGDVQWDPMRATVDVAGIEGVDVVIHLSGAGIADGRWTDDRKKVLRSSRVDTTRVLVDSLSRLKQKPRVLLAASAIGYYGLRGDEILTESSTSGTDFLALV